jgi:hypothetical protein
VTSVGRRARGPGGATELNDGGSGTGLDDDSAWLNGDGARWHRAWWAELNDSGGTWCIGTQPAVFVDLGFQLGKLLDSALAMVIASRSGSCKLGMGFRMPLGSG